MTDYDDAIFQDNSSSSGRVRLDRLASAADIGVDELDARGRHRLERALACGFRGPVVRVLNEMERASAWRAALAEMPKRWWFVHGDLEVVVTGFGPFQSHETNPSKPFARAVAAGVSSQLASSYEGLGVTFHAADEFVKLQDYDSQPVIIHCGLSEEREAICLERYAHNVTGSTADNDGVTGGDGWVVSGGPVALETLLPIESLAGQFGKALSPTERIDVETSRDAGEYVCNALYYRSLLAVRHARLVDHAADALFVHIPTLSAERASRCGRIIGKVLGDFLVSALSEQFVDALE